MATLDNDPPSPGHSDDISPDTPDDFGLKNDLPSDNSLNKTPGHQGVHNTGGISESLNVLVCSQLSLFTDYDVLYETFKSFGIIKRIKLKPDSDSSVFNAYITFDNHASTLKAYEQNIGKCIGNSTAKLKLMESKNLVDDDFDFIPKVDEHTEERQKIVRPKPSLIWHVAEFKEGSDNLRKAADCIE